MLVKSILATTSSADSGRPTLETALQIASRFNSHIEALHVRADPRGLVPYTGEGMDGTMIEEIMDVTEREGGERAASAKTMFDAFCAEKSVKISDAPSSEAEVTIAWHEEVGREDESVAVRGRLFDIIVVGRPVRDTALPSPITLEAALLDTGRPIVIAPPKPLADTGNSIAIAWEASPEAARAIADAMPLLRKAKTVTILDPDISPPPVLPAQDLVDRLAWNGVTATIQKLNAKETELGHAFLEGAMTSGADMLIKGAYSQSRLRQLILGGRTRYIISNTTIPVFLAH